MQIAGLTICTLVVIRLLQSVVAAFQSHARRKATAVQADLLLGEQIAATKALRIQPEHQHLHWNGYRKFRVGKKVTEAEGTTSLYLLPHDRKPLPTYRQDNISRFVFSCPETNPIS